MRAWAVAVLALACASETGAKQPPKDPLVEFLQGAGAGGPRVLVVQTERLPPVVVALATPGPGVALTPPGELDGQLFIAAEEAWKRLAVDVQKGPAAPHIPPALRRSGMYIWGVFRICANEKGAPSAVTQLQSADKLVDEDWRRALRQWRFRPLVGEGGAKAFCSDVPVGAKVQ